MKKLFVTLLALSTLPVFAGSLVNQFTGEKLHFELNMEDKLIHVLSEDFSFPSQAIELKKMRQNNDDTVRLLAMNNFVDDEIYSDAGNTDLEQQLLSIFAPVFNIPKIAATAVDLAMLPVKLPIKLVQNSTRKGDFKSLVKAVTTDEMVTVSSSRYDRIKEVLVRVETIGRRN